MIKFTKITEDNLPELGVPVILAWEKNPFKKTNKPLVGFAAYKRTNYEEGWLWEEVTGAEETMDWEDNYKPTHFALYPEFLIDEK